MQFLLLVGDELISSVTASRLQLVRWNGARFTEAIMAKLLEVNSTLKTDAPERAYETAEVTADDLE